MKSYIHKVQYYETDKMGFVHHSNYIRWFEEARLDFMDKQGFSYKSFEDLGYISPVLSAECKYKKSVRFGEPLRKPEDDEAPVESEAENQAGEIDNSDVEDPIDISLPDDIQLSLFD